MDQRDAWLLMKFVVCLGAVGAGVFGLVIGLATVAGGAAPAAATTPACVTSGPLVGLGEAAATNARIVAGVAEQTGGPAAAVIAVMTAYTESGLLSLSNPIVDGSQPIGQGIGEDHDSIGIFQQRASWGTVAQRMDPAQSTRLFVARLLDDTGWQSKQPWTAAQDVQQSAYDGRPRGVNHDSSVYGGNYEANLALAQTVVDQVDRDVAAHPCGALTGGVPANTAPGSHGLPADYVVPASATEAEAKVVLFAIAQLDKPYVFGAAGPAAFDCSGLTMAAWQQAGVALPHSSAAQLLVGTPTIAGVLVPGDLVLVPGDDGTLAAPGHVGIYIGDGLVLNAADQQDGIRVQSFGNFVSVGHGLSGLRHLG
jgi:cell wall-associated NlpC family hydrolase